MNCKKKVIVTILALVCFLVSCGSTTTTTEDKMKYRDPFDLKYDDPFEDTSIITPKKSDFFSTVSIEDKSSYETYSDGDLWPSAWSNDDVLYLANGDGKGFGMNQNWNDIVMNKITGSPYDSSLKGEKIITQTELSRVWGDSEKYNRKPTSMISVDGVLYMAIQDLNKVSGGTMFNDAPNATIIKSVDKGVNWTWDKAKPMFDNHEFTTVMFLDYGKDSSNNIFDEYVYAYGLDYNWRDSFGGTVPDPQNLYLARVHKNEIMDISKWSYYTGDLDGNASWSTNGDIKSKKPILTDERRIYTNKINGQHHNFSVLSQSSIVYNEPIKRYIYSSWTEFTFEFYEAPTPFGPWKHFYTKDFGAYPWNNNKFGGYTTVIPSKYISEDGLTMYVNANTFASESLKRYNYSLRKLEVTVKKEATPTNQKSNNNLANRSYTKNPTAINVSTNLGVANKLNDGNKKIWDESYNKLAKKVDYWGYEFDGSYHFNELAYTVGKVTELGGWFNNFKVQVKQNGKWIDCENLMISDNYAFDDTQKSFETIHINFKDTWGEGIRIIGIPGGINYSTSIAELEVYYK